jgi:OOP family OmpA-OmpF porin
VFEPQPDVLVASILRVPEPMQGDLLIPRLVFDSNLLFDPGSAALKPGVIAEFQNVADFIKFHGPSKLIIEGYTDGDGEPDYNLDLSLRRAEAVRQSLIATYDYIEPEMLGAKGYGEERPLAENDTDENKARNRRIEVTVFWASLEEKVEQRADQTQPLGGAAP